MFSNFVFPFHTKELQSYLLRLRALKAPSVYPHSKVHSSSRTFYSVPSDQLIFSNTYIYVVIESLTVLNNNFQHDIYFIALTSVFIFSI
jgi:hypothetical protein